MIAAKPAHDAAQRINVSQIHQVQSFVSLPAPSMSCTLAAIQRLRVVSCQPGENENILLSIAPCGGAYAGSLAQIIALSFAVHTYTIYAYTSLSPLHMLRVKPRNLAQILDRDMHTPLACLPHSC